MTPLPMPDAIVAHAETDEGHVLPVIDVTHPLFALADDPESLAVSAEAYRDSEQRGARIPAFVTRLMLRLAARRSLLIRALVHPHAGYLDGLSTYILKLGAHNLPSPFNSDIDRRLAATPQVVAMRLRLQQTARLIAEGLEPHLDAAPGAPLHLLNIGGGPAIDSLNALTLLKQVRPEATARPITVHVLDLDTAGPRFGAAALEALRTADGPLAGMDVTFSHDTYDWNAAAALDGFVRQAAADGAILAASSEGALFEYGSDDAIVANLKALHAGGTGVKLAVGSVTRADRFRRRTIMTGGFNLVPRGIDGFAPLAKQGGFDIARIEAAPISDQVLLRPR